jgi:hypothetical protein
MYYGVMGQPDCSKYIKIYTIKKPNGIFLFIPHLSISLSNGIRISMPNSK